VNENIRIRRALLSVSDKTGLVDFARELISHEVEILSTGGTARTLQQAGIPVTPVSSVTGFPEILGGRVKTLHPKIHGGILARRGDSGQMAELEQHGIAPIDLVAVNLYPFEKTVSSADVTVADALENIDIGGPCMIRAAAKNYPAVAVIVEPAQYGQVIAEMKENGGSLSLETRRGLSLRAFQRTGQYDGAISAFLEGGESSDAPPEAPSLHLRKVQDLRYGENPHQSAALYKDASSYAVNPEYARQLHGKALSFNNILDMNAAIGLVAEFDSPCAVVLKHNNPCGAAVDTDIFKAYELAFQTDPVSAFGGIVALNRELDTPVAEKMSKVFLEVVLAPSFSSAALELLTVKKNIRLIEWPMDRAGQTGWDIKKVQDGYLLQSMDSGPGSEPEFKVVSERQPTEEEWEGMRFGWKVVKWVKSNAVIYVKSGRTVGIGAGQMSRIDSSKLAVAKANEAGLDLNGTVVVSDAFFPFRDGVDAAAEAGATAVIEPGGSIRDEEVIAAANERGMAMVFTGIRHFRH